MFTDEQQAIIDSNAHRMRVLAFAGTGKTSTLVGYGQARSEKMLYLAYNKAIAMDASRRFSPNVSCRTAHSLAFSVYGKLYKHKLGSMRVYDVAEVLRLSYAQSAMVATTVANFHNSADERIHERHLPPNQNRNHAMERHNVLEGARTLWERMQDLQDTKVAMPHDGYLKLYALSKPSLGKGCVMFDEAQDANGCMSSIILSHPGRLLVVGDPYQAVYEWRGARDALKEVRDAETFSLTRSFRFGREVARVANHLLAYLGEPRRVIGAGAYLDGPLHIDPTRPYALIARTNITLIQAAIDTLPKRLRSYYVGGVENVGLNLIWDGYQLYRGQREAINDRFIKKFDSLSALNEYAKQANDFEMIRLYQIVTTYSHRIPDILQQIRALAADAVEDADRIFTTAHRSKGLEFDQAILADDFCELLSDGRPIALSDLDRQDIHLHYVAATRGIEAMQPSPQLAAFVRYCEGHPMATAQSTVEALAPAPSAPPRAPIPAYPSEQPGKTGDFFDDDRDGPFFKPVPLPRLDTR